MKELTELMLGRSLCEECNMDDCPAWASGFTCPEKGMREAYIHIFQQQLACENINMNNQPGGHGHE